MRVLGICAPAPVESDLAVAASFSKPSEPCHSATFMHRLTETFVHVADQIDRAVTFATVGTGIVGLQPDYFVAVYGFRAMVLF